MVSVFETYTRLMRERVLSGSISSFCETGETGCKINMNSMQNRMLNWTSFPRKFGRKGPECFYSPYPTSHFPYPISRPKFDTLSLATTSLAHTFLDTCSQPPSNLLNRSKPTHLSRRWIKVKKCLLKSIPKFRPNPKIFQHAISVVRLRQKYYII